MKFGCKEVESSLNASHVQKLTFVSRYLTKFLVFTITFYIFSELRYFFEELTLFVVSKVNSPKIQCKHYQDVKVCYVSKCSTCLCPSCLVITTVNLECMLSYNLTGTLNQGNNGSGVARNSTWGVQLDIFGQKTLVILSFCM